MPGQPKNPGLIDSRLGSMPDPRVAASVATIRIQFLCLNAVLLFLCILIGMIIYQTTESLTVELDLVGFGCDTLALLLNITIEFAKIWVHNPRYILIMDLAGFVLSLALLIGVALFGLAQSVRSYRSESAVRQAVHVSRLDAMVCYAMFTLIVNVVVISLFMYLKELMLPPSKSGARDQLNVQSSVAHACAGYVSSFVVLGTSIFLMFCVPHDVPMLEKARQKVHIDVWGSVAVCLCICVSIIYVFREAMHTVMRIWSFDEACAGVSISGYAPSKPRNEYGATGAMAMASSFV